MKRVMQAIAMWIETLILNDSSSETYALQRELSSTALAARIRAKGNGAYEL